MAYSGGLFEVGDLLRRPLADELARIASNARLHRAAGDAIAGGAVLAASAEPVLRGISSWLPGRL